MMSDTLTLALDGDVSLDAFVKATQSLKALIDALAADISRDADIVWTVVDLQAGSAITTIRGEAEQADVVERVVRAYVVVGKSLERHEAIPYSDRVTRAARAITSILSDQITAIRFESANESALIVDAVDGRGPAVTKAYGAIKGRIQTLTNRHGLKFTLYDDLHDRAVSCYLGADQVELIRDAWGKQGLVSGLIERDATSGRPISIREVRDIVALEPSVRGSYRLARAIAPVPAQALSPEEATRRIRDAQ